MTFSPGTQPLWQRTALFSPAPSCSPALFRCIVWETPKAVLERGLLSEKCTLERVIVRTHSLRPPAQKHWAISAAPLGCALKHDPLVLSRVAQYGACFVDDAQMLLDSSFSARMTDPSSRLSARAGPGRTVVFETPSGVSVCVCLPVFAFLHIVWKVLLSSIAFPSYTVLRCKYRCRVKFIKIHLSM